VENLLPLADLKMVASAQKPVVKYLIAVNALIATHKFFGYKSIKKSFYLILSILQQTHTPTDIF
jgi:hypothetical protein